MSDTLKDLCDLLAESTLTLTFSKDCVSGLIGRKMCRCWRCRKVEPEEQEPEWERVAELVTTGFHAEMDLKIRAQRERLAATAAAPLASRGNEPRIKALFEAGRVWEAQTVILEELGRRYCSVDLDREAEQMIHDNLWDLIDELEEGKP